MIGRAALALVAGCAVAHADASAPGAAGDRIDCTVEVVGQFSARGSFDVNRINEPPTGGPAEPPPLAVSARQLALLNRELSRAVEATVAELGWRRMPRAPDKAGALVRELGGDRYFALRVEASPENGMGGHFGGLDLGVTLRSLHRKERLHNFEIATVKLGRDDELAANLRAALRRPMADSLRGLRALIARPVGEVEVVLVAPGADPAAVDQVAGCAAQLAEPVAVERILPGRVGRRVLFRVGRWSPSATEEDWLRDYVERLRGIATPMLGGSCAARTGLEGRAVTVAREGRTLTVRFAER